MKHSQLPNAFAIPLLFVCELNARPNIYTKESMRHRGLSLVNASDTNALGHHGQPTSSPLINKESASADQLGLHQYALTTNLVNGLRIKETNSIVDLPCHRVALGGGGAPISASANGAPDYLAHTNRNAGGSCTTSCDSPNGSMKTKMNRPGLHVVDII